ncbi:MAG: SGNH/GDSL hydrolase family protein [Planctomycetes bacterium]|nr:SGNH/GDSL hydrolase family protein [Planctomycetota bacterium]
MIRSARLRRALRASLLAAFGVLLAAGVLELALRVIDPFHDAEVAERERFAAQVLQRPGDGRLALIPGSRGSLFGHLHVIGSSGFRTPDFAPAPAPDTFRVLVVGDSVAFGWGVASDDAFPRVVERDLSEPPRPLGRGRVEVVNASTPGWGAPAYLEFLQQRGRELAPDLVVVTLISNDVTDVIEVLNPPSDAPPAPPAGLPGWLRWSRLARVVDRAIEHLGSDSRRADYLTSDVFFAELRSAPGYEPAQRALAEAFAAMRAAVPDSRFVVMDTVVAGDRQLDTLAGTLRERGIDRLAVQMPPAEEYVERYAVGATDVHPNAAGHRLLADQLTAWIRANVH